MTPKARTSIDLNSADEETLVEKLQIPARLARRILALRPYHSVEQLEKVWGIDAETLQRILPLVSVSEEGLVTQTKEGAATGVTTETTPLNARAARRKTMMEAGTPELEAGEAAPARTPRTRKKAQEIEVEVEVAPVPEAVPEKEKRQITFPALRIPTIRVDWKLNFILLLILLVGAFFRFTGVNWDDNHHLHPDERFITSVADQIRGVSGIGAYFNTATSTLNPLNFGSYTYGMLPLFFTRMISEWVNMANYDSIVLVGRVMSGLFDLAALLMLFLLGEKLYNRRTGLLAAILGAAAVLPIQLSHYFTVDSFSTVFVVASFYFALLASPLKNEERVGWSNLFHFGIFGFIVGLAGACKVNTLPVFGVIVVAGLARLVMAWRKPEFGSLLKVILPGWALSALMAFVAFRIFQPYAFTGPDFFGFALNQRWLDVIKEVTNQVAGNSEWPPNHHWTNRALPYAWENMVVWGMGVPLGLAGWLGWIWAGWRIWKGEWRSHLLPFVWVAGYFIWQNAQFWRYMRYFLPIYPFIILFAAWALMEIYERTRESRAILLENGFDLFSVQLPAWRSTWKGVLGLLVMGTVLLGTYIYALAFVQIYTQPVTRVSASRWILQNIPGPLNLTVDSPQGSQSYPVSIGNHQVVLPGDSPTINLQMTRSGTTSRFTTTNVTQVGVAMYFRITKDKEGKNIVTDSRLSLADDEQNKQQLLTFGDVTLAQGQTYYLYYKINNNSQFSLSDVKLRNDNDNDPFIPLNLNIQNQAPGTLEGTIALPMSFPLRVNRIQINQFQQTFVPMQTTLRVSLFREGDDQNPLVSASQKLNFTQAGLKLAPTFLFPAVQVTGGKTYMVRYEVTGGGPVQMLGDSYTLETSWDDALPLSVDKYDALGGIYTPLNLELYEPDTPQKRDSMIKILSESDYIVISSNRAYDAMPRLPLRYPMTLKYYQDLFDCNCNGDAMEERAYSLKAPFKSPLGFDLVATFDNPPALGPLVFHDENADESFTVYDHPKVFIFKKSSTFSLDHVKALLNSVDLNQVIFQTPLSYTEAPNALQLYPQQLAIQTAGGTWSDMFNPASLLNSNQTLAIVAWYLLLLLLGWMVFPLLQLAFSGLPDRGYPLARLGGLLLLAWLAWITGSLNLLPFTQLTILLGVLLLLALNLFLAYRQRSALLKYVQSQWRHILVSEAIFLAVFLLSLSIRLGNPDLWNPWLGGEKPMDFTYFNSVLKAVYFPPENAWFSGHTLNYYYYGYVIAAIPTKLLAIVPSIAYNLILPAWFAMTGTGVFCLAYNLVAGLRKDEDGDEPETVRKAGWQRGLPYIAGAIALAAVLLLGNLYEVRQLWQYLPEAANFSGDISSPGDHAGAVVAGAIRVIAGQTPLPGDKGRWYFGPSRPILHDGPDTPIAEFPYFTFLYGDLHAHLLTMPFYALALCWMLAILIKPMGRVKWGDRIANLLMAGIFIGFYRAAHTWDFPTFTGLAVLAIIWCEWRSRSGSMRQAMQVIAVYGVVFLAAATLCYWPFTQNFHTEYVALDLWTGARTPLVDYLFVFGLGLFVMITLLVRDLAVEFKKISHYWMETAGEDGVISPAHLKWYGAALLSLMAMVLLWVTDYQVLAFSLPFLAALVYLVFFKTDLSLLRRVVWILFAVGLGLTWMVEVVVLRGDVGRSNTLFRFYMEAWFILGVALSVALAELIAEFPSWPRQARWSWTPLLGLLLLSAASYPLIATNLKMTDRWPNIANPPHTLDGAAFMLGDSIDTSGQSPAIYNDDNRNINISLDYPAIQFMQEHVVGSPVIVEGNTAEYRWGSRFSIYTGLPSVVGWSWHTRQHNSLLDGALIDKRINDIKDFYNTQDIQAAKQFLTTYQVKYIVVGGLERVYYDANGLNKFQDMVKQGLLKMVFGNNSANTTTVFEVENVK